MSGLYGPSCRMILLFGLALLSVEAHGPEFPRLSAPPPLLTRWGRQVTPANAWTQYPRPQMVRRDWQNLNGLWDYSLTEAAASRPGPFAGKILVPFCIESPLSGVGHHVAPEQRLWYHRQFRLPEGWKGRRVLLHFGAVDWEAVVWINDRMVGSHRGGYVPFTLDITEALNSAGLQNIVVRVLDPKETGFQLSGKQHFAFDLYETTTGIWQTVWLEPVAPASIERLKLTPDVENRRLRVESAIRGNGAGFRLKLTAREGETVSARVEGKAGDPLFLEIPKPKLWSPESPFLYGLKAELSLDGNAVDAVESYFGMRGIARDRDEKGLNRIVLNGKPLFQLGPLDQAYWPDGVFTPPSEAAMVWELEYLKSIACNMERLHIKTNPDLWYYHCDRLGLLVWQDFVSGPRSLQYTPETSADWRREQKEMVDALYNHPSVVMWIVFNEGWGQHDTADNARWIMEVDSSRLVNAVSGWNDVPELAHIRDIHDYTTQPSVSSPGSEPHRAVVLGEFGGFSSIVPGHNWHGDLPPEKNDDFEWVTDIRRPSYSLGPALAAHYAALVEDLRLLQSRGLCGAVYTQMTDMKREQNGFLSFDRETSKIDPGTLRAIHQRLFLPPPALQSLWPGEPPAVWRYSGEKPNGPWFSPDFDDSGWKQGTGPFGNLTGDRPGTYLSGRTFALRKFFLLENVPEKAVLEIECLGEFAHEITTCKIYLNGTLAKIDTARHRRLESGVSVFHLHPDALRLLGQGPNLIAVQFDKGDADLRLLNIGLFRIIR